MRVRTQVILRQGSATFYERRAVWVQFPQQKEQREPPYVTLKHKCSPKKEKKGLRLQSVAKNRHGSLHLPINVLRKQEKALVVY